MFKFDYTIKDYEVRKENVEKYIKDNKILEKIEELTIKNTVPRKKDKDGNVLEWYVQGDQELKQLQYLVQKCIIMCYMLMIKAFLKTKK